jgi:predicted RNase H-like nuclease
VRTRGHAQAADDRSARDGGKKPDPHSDRVYGIAASRITSAPSRVAGYRRGYGRNNESGRADSEPASITGAQ